MARVMQTSRLPKYGAAGKPRATASPKTMASVAQAQAPAPRAQAPFPRVYSPASRAHMPAPLALTPAPRVHSPASSPKVTVDHPPYAEMIHDAIAKNKSPSGTSRQTIAKHIEANYKLVGSETAIKSHLRQALVRGVNTGILIQVTGTGASGSFKIAEQGNATKTRPSKVTTPKKKAATPKKAATTKKKATTSKAATNPPPQAN